MRNNFRIYLAGFDVFFKNSIEHGKDLVAQCAAKGAVGLYPLDNQCPPGLTGVAMARWIAEANEAMINSCDAVLVNLNPFRGDEPDSGSVYEFGYAHGRGKPVWGYFADHRPMIEKIAGVEGFDASGMAIEDFGLPLNLMLATRWVGASTTFEAGLEGVLAYLNELTASHDAASFKRRPPAVDEPAP